MRRWGARRDENEQAIVDALEAIGVDVWRISAPGMPDLLTHSRGRWLPIEVKESSKAHLTTAQAETYQRAPFPVVTSVAEALSLFGVSC